jgi:hypothetical protein
MKRFSVCILIAAVAGCAGHPQQSGPAPGQPVAQQPATKQVPVTMANATEVQHAGYKLVNKDGEKLYCRTDPITGSRLQTHTQCLTEQEMYDQNHQTQNAMSLATQVGGQQSREGK